MGRQWECEGMISLVLSTVAAIVGDGMADGLEMDLRKWGYDSETQMVPTLI